eukprot:TRINITY_DN694_c0_g2_i1.p1 TRINITY_DN694_c0_g2~~TRINITY_DN694_c0_g2_i1.p1  ORF type:complete len:423 (-),score=8.27 TRINITY_DN694_c0_g2_i1:1026-2294(-)
MNRKFDIISEQVNEIELIDTHEHLVDETERLSFQKPFIQCDDWTTILGLYTKFDFVSSGMSQKEVDVILASTVDPLEKWKILAPYWEAIKYTANGQVIRHSINDLYGIADLEEKVIPELQERYLDYRKKGFYAETLKRANIKTCIVNPPGRPFKETELPDLLNQDIDALGMLWVDVERYNENICAEVKSLDDWLEVINWWFEKYSQVAAGVKIGMAYFRRLDFRKTAKDVAAPVFVKKMAGENLSEAEERKLQDFLFWYVVEKATQNGLAVKLHTGQQAMNNFMDLENVMFNPSDCASLCRLSPETTFVFFHISYPHYEPMISLARHYSNAMIDMCWAWTLNPVASVDFLKKYIMSAPSNKLMVFGGDDLYVENLVGHAKIARHGISLALSELVEDRWMSEKDALEVANKIMWKNAKRMYGI